MALPVWLIPFLQTEFYTTHVHDAAGRAEKTSLFCKTCSHGPLCDTCSKNEHKGHEIIQVFKASNAVCVRTNAIKDYVEVGGIQPFSVNSKSIFFLNKRIKPSQLGTSPRCEVCQGHIKDPAYKFCSIGCKIEFVHGNLHHQESDHPNGHVLENPYNGEVGHHPNKNTLPIYDNPQVQPPQRRHRRKGIPHRSPLH